MTQNNSGEKLNLDSHKLLWHRDRVESWLRGDRIAPITIDCALTRACNQNCVYCYGRLQENESKRLTKDAIYGFLDDAADIGVKAISLVSDGESPCSPHFVDSIVHGKQNGLDMAVATNGALLTEENLEKILPSLTYLRFNISAGEEPRYDEIHRGRKGDFHRACANIRNAVAIKKRDSLPVTIGMQMVLMPQLADQIMPLSKLGRELGADYLVIKHCSDDENHQLGVDYQKYFGLVERLKEAESLSVPGYQVSAKWSKILSGGKRSYSRCYGPAFIMQFSGSGLVAPCGMLFNDKYKKYHIGNIAEESFKEIWKGKRYGEVLDLLASDRFDARTMCGTLCLQHKVNEYLSGIKSGEIPLVNPEGNPPQHVNFI